MRPWHVVLFLVALAVFAAARAPAAVLAPQRPGVWTYASAQGTAWSARFADARLGALDAGDIAWRLQPAAFAAGAAAGEATFSGGMIDGAVSVRIAPGGRRRVSSRALRLQGLPWRGGPPLAGIVLARDLDIAFSGGRCASASGVAESDILARNATRLGWAGPPLRGAAACDGADAVIALADPTGLFTARAVLRPDGAATWRLHVQSASGEQASALAANGFTPDPTGAPGMELTGDVRWLPF